MRLNQEKNAPVVVQKESAHEMNFKYKKIALGGTFDLLHKGHKALILKAFEVGKFVTIGITTDEFNKKESKKTFEDQKQRLKSLKFFLKGRKYTVVWLNDIFGTTLNDPQLRAIVVSPETKAAAQLINKKRVKKGLKSLDIITLPLMKDQDGKVISSTRVKNGEIDPAGISYRKLLLKSAGKKLPEKVRDELKKPLGKIIPAMDIKQVGFNTVSVGDITTQKLLQAGIAPKLAVVDHLVGRQLIPEWSTPTIKIVNQPGRISKSLILAIEKGLKSGKNQTILVKGEEDLATIPAILLAPLGTNIVYGQPQKGAVLVNVNLGIKNKLYKLLDRIIDKIS